MWALQNSHNARARQQFSIKVWAGIIGDHIIGPQMLPAWINGSQYSLLVQQENQLVGGHSI